MRPITVKTKRLMLCALSCALIFAVAGCDTPSTPSGGNCNNPLSAGQDLKCSEGNRSYYVYASKNYDPKKPTALIVDAHGAQSTAEQEAGLASDYCAGEICLGGGGSGWRLEADMPGNNFVVLTPQGRNNAWMPSDESFILAAVERVKKIANINTVFMSGISNGGLLSYWTGCPNTDVFSGLAPIVGGATCSEIAKPMPVISFDAKPDFAYVTTERASNKMVELNHCKSGPVPYLTIDSSYDEPVCRDDIYGKDPKLVPCSSITPAIKPTVCKKWTNCDGGVEVVFCDVDPANNYGADNAVLEAHVLVANDTHLNMPSIAWRFFKKYAGDSGSGTPGDEPATPGCR